MMLRESTYMAINFLMLRKEQLELLCSNPYILCDDTRQNLIMFSLLALRHAHLKMLNH